jgi:hypothetical protein
MKCSCGEIMEGQMDNYKCKCGTTFINGVWDEHKKKLRIFNLCMRISLEG